jgi:O-antigen/teichoic acid export membrane protein
MSTKPESVAALPGRDFRDVVRTKLRIKPKQSQLVTGSLVMLAGSMMVSVLNFGYNMVVARMLGKAAFAEAAAAVTLQLIVSAITLSHQLVCAKFVARNQTDAGKSYAYRSLLRRSWLIGISVGIALAVISVPGAHWLQMSSPRTILILAVGMAFYVPLGVKRGGLQGVCQFRQLSVNFVLETIVKMLGAVALLYMGLGIDGAVAALSLSVIAAYFYPRVPVELRKQPERGIPASFGEGVQAIIFFVGQVVINNVDILMVNHFFKPEVAGLYAAIALVGRVLYIASWQVVSAMFPIAAKNDSQEKESWSVIGIPLGIVVLMSVGFLAVVGLFPDPVLHVLFGAKFQISGAGVDNLLMLRTIATGGYALSVVIMSYEMSRRIANAGWFQLVIAGLVVLGISVFHGSLQQVIVLQQVLMAVLLICVAVPFVRARRAQIRGAA